MKVLELFAGVGGYHVALKTLFPGIRLEVRAYDNNQPAVQTYKLNLDANVEKANIEHLQPDDVDGFDLWAMSPPCQPHTHTSMSLQRDSTDERSTPFSHICDLLEGILHPPEYIICENVPGFVSSDQFKRFRSALAHRDYDWQAFLVTPQMLSVPNRRPRVFVLALRRVGSKAQLSLPNLCGHLVLAMPEACMELGIEELLHKRLMVPISVCKPSKDSGLYHYTFDHTAAWTDDTAGDLWKDSGLLEHFVGSDKKHPSGEGACTAEHGTCERCETALHMLPDLLDMQRALKVHRVLDVVTESSILTNCFTKSYRKNLFGAGSVIASESFASHFCEASHGGRLVISDAGKQALLALMAGNQSACEKVHTHLRWFRASEVAKLHGYPDWFTFPDHLTQRQRCALLGNGLSLHCVRPLLRHLLSHITA